MTKYRKKPVVITAITFYQLVAHGLTQTPAVANGMPWSFTYAGHAITHENDNCYLIPTLEGSMKMGRDDMLITGVKGEIYPCKRDIFEATYEAESVDVGADLPPHQQRVLAEKAELDERLSKLDAFILDNPLYLQLPGDEQKRLSAQSEAMASYSSILGERIASF